MSINVKSIVFYPKEAFEAAGYEVPETYDDLVALTDQIQETGTTPWCFGIESEAATGWPATDWVENLMRDQQRRRRLQPVGRPRDPVQRPQVAERAASRWRTCCSPRAVPTAAGSRSRARNFGTAGNPMFDDPPGCFMYRQGNFVAQEGGFPDEVMADLDNRRRRLPDARPVGRGQAGARRR